MRYEKVVPLLIESIKELSQNNKNLDTRNHELAEKVETLENENKNIKQQLAKIMEELKLV